LLIYSRIKRALLKAVVHLMGYGLSAPFPATNRPAESGEALACIQPVTNFLLLVFAPDRRFANPTPRAIEAVETTSGAEGAAQIVGRLREFSTAMAAHVPKCSSHEKPRMKRAKG
jgi:hypothetical protein